MAFTMARLAAAFQSPGIAMPPEACGLCPQKHNGSCGFALDYWPAKAKVGVLLPYPSTKDAEARRPWAGEAGAYWRHLCFPQLTAEEVGVSHVLRCRPVRKPRKRVEESYPTGDVGRLTETYCRRWDDLRGDGQPEPVSGGLVAWNPDCFLITYRPAKAMQVQAFKQQLQIDCAKAVYLADNGYRPLVLMGQEALELIAPNLRGKGGVTVWRSHWWEGEWPWKTPPVPVLQVSFPEAKNKWHMRWKQKNA